MNKFKFLGIALVGILFGCEDESSNSAKGDINVTVRYENGTLVENANVYTKPKTVDGITDNFGSVLLKGIDQGAIEIFANVGGIGSGKSIAQVRANELIEVEVEIIKGTSDGISPQIRITSPENWKGYAFGDTIEFSAIVLDDQTPSSAIKIVWESDIDGILSTISPVDDGRVSFKTHTLSRAQHKITLLAEDLDGYKSLASINVSTLNPKEVQLKEVVKVDGDVKISWTKYIGNDFLKYEIYRSIQGCYEEYLELIGVINNISDTIFIDNSHPLAYQACYVIKVTTTNNMSRLSNFYSIDYPGGVFFNFVPDDMLKHPTGSFVYLISKSNKKLLKYDYSSDSIINEISMTGTPGFCDVGENGFGVEIYVPSSDGHIYVYDADDLALVSTISTDLPAASVVIDGNGHIIASVAPDPWWEQPVRTYSRANGMYIDGCDGIGLVFEESRLRLIPNTSEVISISTTVSPIDMDYFKIGNDGTILEQIDDQYHGDYGLDPQIFRVSDDGSYVITSTGGEVYLANSTMAYQGNLASGGLNYSDFAFSADGKTIYAATSDRKSIQIGKYPELIRENEMTLNGYPKFIFRDSDKLIVLLTTEMENSLKSGINIIKTP